MAGAWTALAAMLSIYFFSYFQRTAIPGTIFDEIQSEMKMSATGVATLGSLFLGIYAGSQLFIGMAVDRFGGRRVLLVGMLLMTAGALWFPLARTVSGLYAARALTGFGASFMYLSIVHEVATLFDARRFPAVLGIVLFVGYAGGMTATLPFAALVKVAGWRESLLGLALVLALCGLASWLLLRRMPGSRHVPVKLSWRPLAEVIFSRQNAPLIVACLMNFSVYFVIQNVVGKKFLQDVVGLSITRAASFVLIMAGVSAAAVFFSGFWLRLSSHRRKPVILSFAGLLILGGLLLSVAVGVKAPPFVFLAAYILMAASVGSSTIASATIKELNRPDCVAQSVAVLNGFSYVGVSLLSALAGKILDRFEARSTVTSAGRLYPPEAYLTLFITLTVLSVLSLIALTRVRETAPIRAETAPLSPETTETTA